MHKVLEQGAVVLLLDRVHRQGVGDGLHNAAHVRIDHHTHRTQPQRQVLRQPNALKLADELGC